MPHRESTARFIYSKTTPDTASTAAALASASRVIREFDPARGQVYLTAALRAWSFVAENSGTIPAAGFVNPPGCGTGTMPDESVRQSVLILAAFMQRFVLSGFPPTWLCARRWAWVVMCRACFPLPSLFSQVFDNILWAATELYRATGNASFAHVFESWVAAGSPVYLGVWACPSNTACSSLGQASTL